MSLSTCINFYVWLRNNKLPESFIGSKNPFSQLAELRLKLIRAIIVFLTDFVIFHKHCGDCHVKDEKPANPNNRYEIESNENWLKDVLVHLHDWGPSVTGAHDEDRQERVKDIVELCDSEIKWSKISVNP